MQSPLDNAITRLHKLGRISDSPSYLVRTFLSPANRRAAATILEWMTALDMETSQPPDGTVRGILPGENPSAAPLLLGSHYDTVIDAGKYDGALGIIAATKSQRPATLSRVMNYLVDTNVLPSMVNSPQPPSAMA
jgi:allantoate deiminase